MEQSWDGELKLRGGTVCRPCSGFDRVDFVGDCSIGDLVFEFGQVLNPRELVSLPHGLLGDYFCTLAKSGFAK